MVAFNVPVTLRPPMVLFEPETIRNMVEFPEHTKEPPTNVFPLPLSVTLICAASTIVTLPVQLEEM